MKEEDGNWFFKWEDELPSPEELMPLSQTLITPDLALAFDIRSPTNAGNNHQGHVASTPPPPQQPAALPAAAPSPNSHLAQSQPNNSSEFGADSSELGSGAGGDEPARTLKRPRLVWTPQLHKRFVDAVGHLGIKNAVPKTIMQLMSVDGLTRENVASHLQKYRLYLKRMQGLSSGGAANGGGGGGGGASGLGVADPATEHLFASSPVPAHFLHPGRPSSEHFLPFVPVTALQQQQHHHHQQMAVAAAAAAGHPHLQNHYHRQMGQFEHPFLSRQTPTQHPHPQQQHNVHRMGSALHNSVPGFVEDVESVNGNGARKVLTLFPTGDD